MNGHPKWVPCVSTLDMLAGATWTPKIAMYIQVIPAVHTALNMCSRDRLLCQSAASVFLICFNQSVGTYCTMVTYCTMYLTVYTRVRFHLACLVCPWVCHSMDSFLNFGQFAFDAQEMYTSLSQFVQ